MKSNLTLLSVILIGLSFPASALANGATASFPAGGVVFHHNEHISIEREELTIGLERIHVTSFAHPRTIPLRSRSGFRWQSCCSTAAPTCCS